MMKKEKIFIWLSICMMGLCVAGLTGCGIRENKEAKSEQGTDNEEMQTEETEPGGAGQEIDGDTETEDTGEEDTDKVEVSDETGTEVESAPREISEELAGKIRIAKTRHYYADILSELLFAGKLPDIEVDVTDDFYDTIEDNVFAITDIDNDGREELIICYSTTYMAGMFEVIYDYNPDINQLKQQFLKFPALTYYDNGMIKAEASHNHTRGEFWPYALYQYQSDKDTYEMVAYVDTWYKEYADSFGEGQSFPDELDVDGDGILYNIQIGDNPGYDYADYKYNESDYEAFYQSVMQSALTDGTADEIQIDYVPLTYESFKHYTPEYLELMHEAGKRSSDESKTDIGFLFLEEDRPLDEVEAFLMERYGVEVQSEDEYGDFAIGLYKGEQAFDFVNLDGGDIAYLEKVEDIVVFGIYPGMSVDTAWERLTAYGFYASPVGEVENCLITGAGMGNRCIYFEAEDNKVTQITIRPYCEFTG